MERTTGYLALLAGREFRCLFVGQCLNLAALTSSGIALGTQVHRSTGSALLTALSMFGATFAQLAGSLLLMSHADTRRPRRLLTLIQLATAVTLAAQAAPLGLGARFSLLLLGGLLASVSGGARLGLLREVTGSGRYAPARSLMNVATGVMQILGFSLGSVLLLVLSPAGTFGVAAALSAAAVVPLRGLRRQSTRRVTAPGLRQTLRVNRALLAASRPRILLLALWLPTGLVVGCEALYIPYAGDRAGLLLGAAAAGMLLGDTLTGRFMGPARRAASSGGLRLLLAAGYLPFLAAPPLPVAAALVFCASVGFGGGLALQEALLRHTPPAVSGQVQGVESAGRMACQGLGAVLAGTLAEALPVGVTMTVLAVVSAAITLALWRPVRATLPAAG